MDIANRTSLAPEFGQRHSNYALGILLLVGCMNIADRTIINALLGPMAQDLQLSDWQLGLIVGPAFAVVYSLVQIPIARLADQFSRVLLITIALALWSSMTALQSLAVGFLTLAVLRGAVAITRRRGPFRIAPPLSRILTNSDKRYRPNSFAGTVA